MSTHVLPLSDTPIGRACQVFDLLTAGPHPGEYRPRRPTRHRHPAGFLPLSPVRAWLTDHPDARTAIRQVIAAQARSGRPQWRVAAVALAAPALARLAGTLPGCPCTAEAAAVTQLLDAIDRPRDDAGDWLA